MIYQEVSWHLFSIVSTLFLELVQGSQVSSSYRIRYLIGNINIQLIISIPSALVRQLIHKCAPNTLPPLVGSTFTLPSFARSTSSSIEVTNLPQVSAAEHVKSCRDMSRRAHNAPQLN